MTDNTMAKRKRAKGQTTICKTLHRKLKIEQHEYQSLNSDGQQFHQYQENEQSSLTLNHETKQ